MLRRQILRSKRVKEIQSIYGNVTSDGKYVRLNTNALGIKTEATITKAEQPIGNGVGAVLQVREVLRIVQQHPLRANDLEEKALDLSAQLLVLC